MSIEETNPQRSLLVKTNNAITTQTNPVLRKPDSLHFFRIVKEQPNETHCEAKSSSLGAKFLETETGGANRDRTGDLLLAKQALSQLSYGPVAWFCGGSGWTRTIDPRLIKTVL